jgi:hypothetical protein
MRSREENGKVRLEADESKSSMTPPNGTGLVRGGRRKNARPNDDVLANEHAWWHTGDALNEAAGVLATWVETRQFSGREMIGAACVANVGIDGFGHVWRRGLVGSMLYAFAVETWLKGLIVAAFPRKSPAMFDEIQEMLRERVDPNLRGEECYLAVAEAYDDPAVSAKQKRFLAQKAVEDAERGNAVMAHKSHDLANLAEAAGLVLGQDERAYLDALSYVVQIGRYPAHASKENVDIESLLGDQGCRSKLDAAIMERYVKVRHPL